PAATLPRAVRRAHRPDRARRNELWAALAHVLPLAKCRGNPGVTARDDPTARSIAAPNWVEPGGLPAEGPPDRRLRPEARPRGPRESRPANGSEHMRSK